MPEGKGCVNYMKRWENFLVHGLVESLVLKLFDIDF